MYVAVAAVCLQNSQALCSSFWILFSISLLPLAMCSRGIPKGEMLLVQVDHAGPIPLFLPARARQCAVVLADDTLGRASQGFQGVHFTILRNT